MEKEPEQDLLFAPLTIGKADSHEDDHSDQAHRKQQKSCSKLEALATDIREDQQQETSIAPQGRSRTTAAEDRTGFVLVLHCVLTIDLRDRVRALSRMSGAVSHFSPNCSLPMFERVSCGQGSNSSTRLYF